MTLSTLAVAAIGRRRIAWDVASIGTAAALGLVALLLFAQVTASLHAFSPRALSNLVVGGAATLWVISKAMARFRPARRAARAAAEADAGASTWDRRRILLVGGWLIVVAFALGLTLGYRLPSPVPYQPTWDPFAHLRVIDGLLQGRWSPWTSDYSATFRVNAYLPIHHLTVAMASAITRVKPLAIYWGGPVAMTVAFGSILYVLGRRFSRHWGAAVLAACAGIAAGFPMQAFGFLGLAPASAAGLFFPLALLVVADDGRSVRSRLGTVVILGLGATVAHLLIGPIVLAFGVVALVCREWLAGRRWFSPTVLAACLVVTAVLVLGEVGVLRFPGAALALPGDTGEHELTRTRSLEDRRLDLERHLALVVVVASGLGASLAAAREIRRRPRPGNRDVSQDPANPPDGNRNAADASAWVAALWAGGFVAVFVPIAGADRGFVALPTIIGPPIAILVDATIALTLTRSRWRIPRMVVVTAIGVAACALAFAPVAAFVQNQESQAKEAESLSSFGSQEVAAGRALSEGTPARAFLISDPLSQEFLGGLASRESYGGGQFASDPQLAALRSAFQAPKARAMWLALRAIAPDGGAPRGAPLLVAFEGRTARWLLAPPGSWVGYYSRLDRYLTAARRMAPIRQALTNLEDDRYFQPVWLSPDVRIYAVRPAPNAPVRGISPTAP